MAIGYSKTTWTNGVTPRNAANFNHMENGIKAACDGVDALNNNLGLRYQTNCHTGATHNVASYTTAKLCEDITLPAGYYVISANALPCDDADFVVGYANGGELYASRTIGSIVCLAYFSSEVTLTFIIKTSAEDYTVYADNRFFRFQAMRLR